jgi:hypothetical protein
MSSSRRIMEPITRTLTIQKLMWARKRANRS